MNTIATDTVAPPSAPAPSIFHYLKREHTFVRRQLTRLLIPVVVSVILFVCAVAYFYRRLLDSLANSDLTLYLTPDQLEDLSVSLPGLNDLLIWSALGFGALAFVTTVFAGGYIVLKLVRPLAQFKSAFHAFGEGRLDVDISLGKRDEFQDLGETLNTAAARVQVMILSIKDSTEIIAEQRKGVREHDAVDHAIRGLRESVAYFETLDTGFDVEEANDQFHP
ncbi:MAG: HAMP domain-containing protein [Pseudomonadota bacterium]